MNTYINKPNIAFINLDNLTKVLAWDDQLAARLSVSSDHLTIGDRVIAMRGLRVVAIGWVTNFSNTSYRQAWAHEDHFRISLKPLAEPILPSPKQRNVLVKLAKARRRSFPQLKIVLPIPVDHAPYFDTLINRLRWWPELDSNNSSQRHHTAMLDIIEREDITAQTKINLLLALECRGALADYVFECDEPRIDSDTDDMDLQVTRIVPWEACTDSMRTDPNNYILVEAAFAEHFSFGLTSLRNSGRKMFDPALDREIFNDWVLNHCEYPALNKEQKKYMAYHREHVYKQWRTRLAKPLYVSDQQG
jgi:hypothetical protein